MPCDFARSTSAFRFFRRCSWPALNVGSHGNGAILYRTACNQTAFTPDAARRDRYPSGNGSGAPSMNASPYSAKYE